MKGGVADPRYFSEGSMRPLHLETQEAPSPNLTLGPTTTTSAGRFGLPAKSCQLLAISSSAHRFATTGIL